MGQKEEKNKQAEQMAMLNNLGVKITQITPVEEEIVINKKTYRLKVYSARLQAHYEEKYGAAGLTERFLNKSTSMLTEIAYALIDEQGRKDFPTVDAFRDALNMEDINALETKVYRTMGKAIEVVKKEEDGTKKPDDGRSL